MTLNELIAVFDIDDLNPNAEIIVSDYGSHYVIDDVADRDGKIVFYLGEMQ